MLKQQNHLLRLFIFRLQSQYKINNLYTSGKCLHRQDIPAYTE